MSEFFDMFKIISITITERSGEEKCKSDIFL